MIIEAKKEDVLIISELAILMWEDNTIEELGAEFSQMIGSDNSVIFLAYDGEQPVGFAQCQLRHDYVEGTQSTPVGYLEGIFVKEKYRNKGYGRELLHQCERWAITKGCEEFASDCELNNDTSLKFHLNSGFAEANRIICFTKKL